MTTKNKDLDNLLSQTSNDSVHLLTTLAQNIRFLRNQRGMTRKVLAEQSGVSLPHLARLEGALGNVSIAVLGKVAKALNQPVYRLLKEDKWDSDLSAIVDFLKRQPTQKLSKIKQYLISEFEPTPLDRSDRIALIGLRGGGKSTVGQQLAKRLDCPFIELNQEVEKEAGLSLQEIFNFYGQSGYRNLERQRLEFVLAAYPKMVLATGGGLVVESLTYKILRSSFCTVWLRADPDVYFRRAMGQRDIRIAKPSLYREAIENIRRTLEARDSLYRMADIQVDTSALQVEQVVDEIINRVQFASV